MASGTALLVVDYQNDFADPRGSLHVAGGAAILPGINALMASTRSAGGLVVTTQDWHPADHVSFRAVPELVGRAATRNGGGWPVHCVAGSWGAEFPSGLDLGLVQRRVLKGYERDVESYSGFGGREFSAGRPGATLEELLRSAAVRRVEIAGLTTEHCDRATALDALRLGFAVCVHRGCVRAVDPAAGERALAEMAAAGAAIM